MTVDAQFRLQLPVWNALPRDGQRVLQDIALWTSSAALENVIAMSGGSDVDLGSLQRIEQFAAQNWDFRAGRERDHPFAVDADILSAAVLENSVALGLADRERPLRTHYDVAILTGGMVRAGIVKPRFVSELVASGIGVDRVVFLGAHRRFSAEEAVLARKLGVEGNDEVDGMIAGMRREFHLEVDPDVVRSRGPIWPGSTGRWTWLDHSPLLEVVAAPSVDPARRRANTADTLRFWAAHHAKNVRTVLLITTPVYVPYQAATAVRTLGLEAGLAVDTVGVSLKANDLGQLTQQFTIRHHLQELRAAVHGMSKLENAIRSLPL